MAKKIRITTKALPRVRHVGPVLPRVDPGELAKALGAASVPGAVVEAGSPIGLFALRRALASRLRSSGGRPALAGTSRRAKVPLSDDEWARIERIAEDVSQSGINTTAGQVASVLLHLALDAVVESAAAGVPALRPVCDRFARELAEVRTLRDYLHRIVDRAKWEPAFQQHRTLYPGLVDRVAQRAQGGSAAERSATIEQALADEEARLTGVVDFLRGRIAESVDPAAGTQARAKSDGSSVSRV